MAATGKTTNYNIPIYNAGDTVNDLVSYNTAMTIVDTELKANSVATGVVEDDVAGLTSTVEKHTEDITALNTAVRQAQGSAQGALNQIQEILNPVSVPFVNSNGATVNVTRTDNALYFNVSLSASSILPTITIQGKTFYILAKIDNSNPLSMSPSTFTATSPVMLVTATSKQIYTFTTTHIYYDGTNTFFIAANDLSGVEAPLYFIYLANTFLYNSQPKAN